MVTSTDAETESTDILRGLGAFIDSVIVPLEVDNADLLSERDRRFYAEDGSYAPEVRELIRKVRSLSADAGYYTMFCPESIGGGGLGRRTELLTHEYLAHRYGPEYVLPYEAIGHWAYGPSILCDHFSAELRGSLLGDMMSGRVGMCFGMSEPDAGSDPWMMSTRAVRDGDGWRINGTKQWITNGPHADYCYLFAVTNSELQSARAGGVTCFIVPLNVGGAQVDSVIRQFGEIGGNEAILSFTDVWVPDANVVGEIDQGFKLAMAGVSMGRLYNSGRSLGYARWALERSVDYARSRVTFGKPLAEHQAVSFKLAESALDIYSARHAALDLADRLDRGERAVRELAMAKALCCEALFRVADRAMQIHGGMGLTNELRLHRIWHTARRLQIADGSAEILRVTIAARLLAGDLDF